MTNFNPSDTATKKIHSAIPTLAADGSVIRWEIIVSYSKDSLEFKYNQEVFWMEEGQEMFEPNKPNEFSQSELMSLVPLKSWDAIFDSQYLSLQPQQDQNELTVDKDFDIKKLKQ